jgi:hypothetical protein
VLFIDVATKRLQDGDQAGASSNNYRIDRCASQLANKMAADAAAHGSEENIVESRNPDHNILQTKEFQAKYGKAGVASSNHSSSIHEMYDL